MDDPVKRSFVVIVATRVLAAGCASMTTTVVQTTTSTPAPPASASTIVTADQSIGSLECNDSVIGSGCALLDSQLSSAPVVITAEHVVVACGSTQMLFDPDANTAGELYTSDLVASWHADDLAEMSLTAPVTLSHPD